MRKLLLSFLILNYASFALLCFASVISPEPTTKASTVAHNHYSHTKHDSSSASGCSSKNSDCESNPIDVVLGHAEMYDSITSAELTSLGVVLLLTLVLLVWWGGLYQPTINYLFPTWCQLLRVRIRFFFNQALLAWTLLHTRSPDYIFSTIN